MSTINCLKNQKTKVAWWLFKYGFFLKSEESGHERSAQCMFCYFKYSNQCVAR